MEPSDFAHDRLRDPHQPSRVNETNPGTMGIGARRLNPSYNAVDAGGHLLYPSGYHE